MLHVEAARKFAEQVIINISYTETFDRMCDVHQHNAIN